MTTNGWVTKLLATCLWAALAGVILFMGTVVRENDLTNRSEHTVINDSISDFRVEQMRQGTILERIDDKL